MRRVLAIALLAAAGHALADPRADFHSRVHDLYDFAPHTLQSAEFEAKVKELDLFWSEVKADSTNRLPWLRAELQDASNSPFFFYDGSQLLISLSKARDDRELALRAMAKCDLIDIQPTEYLLAVHRLGSDGFDTTEAALHVLDDPDFEAFIPQHALTLQQRHALVYLLFSMPESTFLPSLVARLASSEQPSAQRSILLALWYTATLQGRQAMQAFVDDPRSPAGTVTFARSLLESPSPESAGLSASAIRSLRAKRMEIMRRPVSDEALIEFSRITAELLGVKKRPAVAS